MEEQVKYDDQIDNNYDDFDIPEFKENQTSEKIKQVIVGVGSQYQNVNTFSEFINAHQALGDALKDDYLDGYRHGYNEVKEIPKELRELSAPYSYVYRSIYSQLHINMQNALYAAQNKERNQIKVEEEENPNQIHEDDEEKELTEVERIQKDIRDLERIIKFNYKSNIRMSKNRQGQMAKRNIADTIIGYTLLFDAKNYGEMIESFAKKYNLSLDTMVKENIDSYKKYINRKRLEQTNETVLTQDQIQANLAKAREKQPIKGQSKLLNSRIFTDNISIEEAINKLGAGFQLHPDYAQIMEYYNGQIETHDTYQEKINAYRERAQETTDTQLKNTYEECAKVYENYALFTNLNMLTKIEAIHSQRGFFNRLFNWRKYRRETRAMNDLKGKVEANPLYQAMKQANPEMSYDDILNASKAELPANYATINRRIKAQEVRSAEKAKLEKSSFKDNAIIEEVDEKQFKYGDEALDEEYQNELYQEDLKETNVFMKGEEAKENMERQLEKLNEFDEEKDAQLKEADKSLLNEQPHIKEEDVIEIK